MQNCEPAVKQWLRGEYALATMEKDSFVGFYELLEKQLAVSNISQQMQKMIKQILVTNKGAMATLVLWLYILATYAVVRRGVVSVVWCGARVATHPWRGGGVGVEGIGSCALARVT